MADTIVYRYRSVATVFQDETALSIFWSTVLFYIPIVAVQLVATEYNVMWAVQTTPVGKCVLIVYDRKYMVSRSIFAFFSMYMQK